MRDARGPQSGESVDLAGKNQLNEVIVERLHAVHLTLGDDVGQLGGPFLVANQVRRTRGVDQDLHRRNLAPALLGKQTLGDNSLQNSGNRVAGRVVSVRREELDDPIDGLDGVGGVHRAQHQVAGLTGGQGGLGRLLVTHLTNDDHVRVLTENPAQGLGEGSTYRSRPRAG